MAHLWRNDAGGWSPVMLDARGAELDRGRVLLRCAPLADDAWVLLAAPGTDVAVNGDAPIAGLAVLRDRDAIRSGGEVVFFAARDAAAVETLDVGAMDDDVACARCRRRLADGAIVVRCPACRAVHHQDDRLPCWTYAERCAACVEPATLDDAPRWSPEEL